MARVLFSCYKECLRFCLQRALAHGGDKVSSRPAVAQPEMPPAAVRRNKEEKTG